MSGASDAAPQPSVSGADADARTQLREEFVRRRGYLAPSQEALLELSPDFFRAYMEYSSVPWTSGTLPRKVKEFIYIAIDASTTHLYESGTRTHIRRALAEGATSEEIVEVLQLISVLGLHAIAVGIPILADELREHAPELADARTESDLERLKAACMDVLGEWDETCEALSRVAPASLESYVRFAAFSRSGRALEPEVKELIAIAINASTTHLHRPGIRLHMRRALRMGVPVAEIVEVLQLTSVLGIHTCSVGVPILLDEMQRAG